MRTRGVWVKCAAVRVRTAFEPRNKNQIRTHKSRAKCARSGIVHKQRRTALEVFVRVVTRNRAKQQPRGTAGAISREPASDKSIQQHQRQNYEDKQTGGRKKNRAYTSCCRIAFCWPTIITLWHCVRWARAHTQRLQPNSRRACSNVVFFPRLCELYMQTYLFDMLLK